MTVDFANLNAPVHNAFGSTTSVSYTPVDGTIVTGLTAIKQAVKVDLYDNEGVMISGPGAATFTFKQAGLVTAASAAITPQYGDIITIGTDLYDVEESGSVIDDLSWDIHTIKRK